MNTSTRPQKTAMLLAQRIVGDIERQSLGAGDRLPPERVMLEDYEVGRGTLRETLRFLELQGVLSIKPGPGGGPVVQRPDASNLATTLVLALQFAGATFRSITDVRLQLEPLMAARAAANSTDEQIAKLEQTLADMETHLENGAAFLDANKRFHDVIAWSSGNPLFGLIVDAILGIMDGTVLGVEYPPHRRTPILNAHRKISRAIAEHDATTAEEAMRKHIQEYVVYAERKFPEVLDQRVTWAAVGI